MTGKEIYDSIKDIGKALTPDMQRMAQEIGQTLQQKGVQGSAELAHGVFAGQAYVPYGPGQQSPDMERGGMSR